MPATDRPIIKACMCRGKLARSQRSRTVCAYVTAYNAVPEGSFPMKGSGLEPLGVSQGQPCQNSYPSHKDA